MTKQRQITHALNSEADIPTHRDGEPEKAAFWDAADFADKFLRNMEPVPEGVLPPVRGHTRPVTIRFDDDIMRRLKEVARQKGKGYQTLLKEFVVERLYEEEVRGGIIPRPVEAISGRAAHD